MQEHVLVPPTVYSGGRDEVVNWLTPDVPGLGFARGGSSLSSGRSTTDGRCRTVLSICPGGESRVLAPLMPPSFPAALPPGAALPAESRRLKTAGVGGLAALKRVFSQPCLASGELRPSALRVSLNCNASKRRSVSRPR